MTRHAFTATVALAATVVARIAGAQSSGVPAPWDVPSAPVSQIPASTSSAPITERYGVVPDPAFSYHFQMPSARPLHRGDTMIQGASALGWAAVRYGVTRQLDVGVGLPYYFAGVSADARYAFWMGDGAALSLWGYATVPFAPGDGSTAGFLGFNWHGGGAAWLVGPLASVWGDRAGIHLGVHAMQRVLLGGLWLMAHATVEGRLADGVRAILQGVVMTEIVSETPGAAALSLGGNGTPRIFPYVLAGLRLHARRFAVDFGAIVVFTSDSPLALGGPSVWPWTAVSQTF